MTISAEDRAKLVALGRAGVEAEVTGVRGPRSEGLEGVMGEHRGCFVTLTNRGRLRGCIGTFHPRGPLAEMLLEMSRAAAHDPRFVANPITPEELDQLTVEISVLSPLEETSEPESLDIGKHGIYIVGRGTAGCFLPEVATDMNWSVEEFLSQCCSGKAGLPPSAWADSDVKVYLFTSEKFDH